ncbi:hypothetical protein [Longispora albida]|uniref:hypothetical protein n=1 Tax=Longispora albida TaxID=203523 RepID=UPI00036305A7|nr:hypothetical protein [Longispora albida]
MHQGTTRRSTTARILAVLTTLLAVFGSVALTAAPAQAAVPGSLGCKISPAVSTSYSSNCRTFKVAAQYSVQFRVAGAPAGTTYQWFLSGPYTGPVYGCTSTTYYCNVSANAMGGDQTITATVVLAYGGELTQLTSSAWIPAVCGGQLC